MKRRRARAVPAQQRLRADCPPGPDAPLRLQLQAELIVQARKQQAGFERDSTRDDGRHAGRKRILRGRSSGHCPIAFVQTERPRCQWRFIRRQAAGCEPGPVGCRRRRHEIASRRAGDRHLRTPQLPVEQPRCEESEHQSRRCLHQVLLLRLQRQRSRDPIGECDPADGECKEQQGAPAREARRKMRHGRRFPVNSRC